MTYLAPYIEFILQAWATVSVTLYFRFVGEPYQKDPTLVQWAVVITTQIFFFLICYQIQQLIMDRIEIKKLRKELNSKILDYDSSSRNPTI